MVGGGLTCGRCGAAAPASAHFCMSCGSPLADAPLVEVRKTVTALSCDVTGSTTLAEQLDPEALRAVMESWFADVQAVLVRHGGTVEKFVGDAVMAVFGAPVTHEDDALRACRAALEILDATESAGRFQVRAGLETGEVLVGDVNRGSTFASGVPVILAARLQSAAGPGEALVGPACLRMVRDHVVVVPRPGLALKNVAEPLDAAALVAVDDARDDVARPSWPLVGRTRELALLQQAFDRAAEDRTCQVATVLGSAGMGKSRVTDEFVAGVGSRALVLRGRCVSYGEGVTYWPLVEVVRQAAGLDGSETVDDARRSVARLLDGAADAAEVVAELAPVVGLGGAPRTSDATSWALRRLLTALARNRPVVLVVEDLHWAEPGLLALLDDLATWLRDAPVLLLGNARPEFLDDHPEWGAGRSNAVTALLEPLKDDEVARLTAEVLGGMLPDDVAARVRHVSGGNPLYIQHLLAVLVDDGLLRRSPDGWTMTGQADTIDVPPTVTALISARLDRLGTAERQVLGVASVMGQTFYRAGLLELAADADAVPALNTLVRKGLVEPADSDLNAQEALRFGHVLVRDAAYDALPKAVRADLHERFAHWLDRTASGQVVDDFVGNHLAAAYLARAELGQTGPEVDALGRAAAARLVAAARQLVFVEDDAALDLLERAERLAPGSGDLLFSARMDRIRVMVGAERRLIEARELAEQLASAAAQAGSPRWTTVAELLLLEIEQDLAPEGVTARMAEAATVAVERFSDPPDHEVLLVAHEVLQNVAIMRGDIDGVAAHFGSLGQHAAAAGRLAEADLVSRGGLMPMFMGTADLRATLAASEERWRTEESLLARMIGLHTTRACALLVGDERLRSEAHEAFERDAPSLRFRSSANLLHFEGMAQLALGHWDAAYDIYAAEAEQDRAAAAVSLLSTRAAWLAIIQLWRDDEASARSWLEVALDTTSQDDDATLAPAAIADAWLAVRAGDPDRAARVLADRRPLLEQMLLDRAAAERALAEVHRLLGDTDGAAEHRDASLELYRRKGALAAVAALEAEGADAPG